MSVRRHLSRLADESRGATIIEFAIIAPTMMIALVGLLDLCYQGYAQSLLTGAVQKIGRDSSLQGGATAAAANDAKVANSVKLIANNATFVISRTSFARFRDVEGEPYTDSNDDGDRDAGECYDDVNNNNGWDANVASAGQGGADDIVVYKVVATYPRLFPMAGLLGWTANQQITAQTLLKNQPFASQNIPTVVSRCT